MSAKPCQICGCTDLNLVDGFFYCVECGTQDTNVRETVVERTIHEDVFGTYQGTDTKKIGKVLKEGIQMSGEWCKWHAYNFILVGLLDELIALGAKPTVKQKALWIWLRYVKKFQKKDEPENTLFENNASNEDNAPNEDKSEDEDKSGDDEEESCKENTDSEPDEPECGGNERRKKNDPDKFTLDIESVTMSVLLGIIYVALNLDRSDIQLSHLYQFMREDHLSVYYCFKFIPKELTFKSIPQSLQFRSSVYPFRFGRCKTPRIRQIAMTLMKRLDLGVPVVPDMNKITDDFIKELCLPNDFRDLVYSLTKVLPCDFLDMDAQAMTRSVHIPDYETYCMAYILLGLKMCFGLDSDYEIKLSDAVDKINSEEEYSKSYKLGIYSEPTDRLFSFKEWYTFIQNRKMILCKYYLPMATLYQLPIDDCTYMEHTEHRQLQSMKLSYEVTMNILNKIPTNKHGYVIPKNEFPVTLTPLATYTEFIRDHVDDPDVKLRLSEDFTQYSLEYATRDLKLPGESENIEGVDRENKILNLHMMLGNLKQIDGDTKMVLVRHCDNKHWLKTKPPGIKHVTKKNSNENYISDDSSSEMLSETNMHESRPVDDYSDEDTCDVIVEEDENISIFDDDFNNLNFMVNIHEDDKLNDTYQPEEERDDFEFNFKAVSQDSETDMHDTTSNMHGSTIDTHETFSENSFPGIVFDPQSFNREKVITELIENVYKKYKIPVPKPTQRIPRKRKIRNTEAAESEPKIKRKRGAGETALDLMNLYYENINNDIIFQLTEHLNSIFETAESKNTDGPQNNILDNAPSIIAKDAINNVTENAPNNITDNGLTNIIDDALNDQTDLQNENEATEALEGETNILGDDQIASFNDDNTQADTADSEVDQDEDDGKFNIEEILPKTDPKFDPTTHDIKQLYVNLTDEFDFIDFSEIDNDPDLNDMIDKKIEEFRDLNVNKSHKNGTGNPSQKNYIGNGETQEPSKNVIPCVQVNEELCNKPVRKKGRSKLEYLVRNRKIRMYNYWIKSYQSRNYYSGTSMDIRFNIEILENCSRTLFFVLSECAHITYRSPFILYKKLRYFENEIIVRYLRQPKHYTRPPIHIR